MIKAIIFDFDGLIVDTETLWYKCFKKVFEDLGHAFPLDLFEQSIGTEFKLNDYIRKYIKIPNSVEVVGDRAKQLFDQEIDNL
ncbi:MAG TPA: HAD hydrolase-like protein, partial [Clostridia bacterium]|nr:HAD hydrolase-like protein [Clostridia bacterium]